MKKILLFQVGTIQYGIDLPLVKDIKSAKSIDSNSTEGDICFIRVLDGRETPLYDLVSIFSGKIVTHGDKNEKLIMVELQGHLIAMIVSGVNQVISIHSDRLMPLSPIFDGPSLSCFPNALKHEGSLILLLRPDGIVKVVEEAGNRPNFFDMPDNGVAARVIKEDFASIKDVSSIADHDDISLVDCWKSESDNSDSLQTVADKAFTPLLEDGGTVNEIPDLSDITGVDDESHCESISFLANHLQNDREASPQTKTDDI